jgi:hypothetical protein
MTPFLATRGWDDKIDSVLITNQPGFSLCITTTSLPHYTPTYKMATSIGRVNLLPTSRTLASGVPLAPRIAHLQPPQAHGHAGPRGDRPPKWAGFQNGFASVSRVNGRCHMMFGQVCRGLAWTWRPSVGLDQVDTIAFSVIRMGRTMLDLLSIAIANSS